MDKETTEAGNTDKASEEGKTNETSEEGNTDETTEAGNSEETKQGDNTELSKTGVEKKKTSHSGMRKTRVGKVLSNKMDKTIIVSEEKRIMHPIYKKYFKKTTKFAAHDPKNTCDIGDTVKIMETRPLSKTKRWRLVEIVEKVK